MTAKPDKVTDEELIGFLHGEELSPEKLHALEDDPERLHRLTEYIELEAGLAAYADSLPLDATTKAASSQTPGNKSYSPFGRDFGAGLIAAVIGLVLLWVVPLMSTAAGATIEGLDAVRSQRLMLWPTVAAAIAAIGLSLRWCGFVQNWIAFVVAALCVYFPTGWALVGQAERDLATAQRRGAEHQAAKLLLEQADRQFLEGDDVPEALTALANALAYAGQDEALERPIRQSLAGWLTQTPRLIQQFEHGQKPVWALAFAQNGRLLLTGGEDGKVLLWDTETGNRLAELAGHAKTVHSIAVSRDGKLAASASLDGDVRIWDLAERSASLRRVIHVGRRLMALAFTSDGKTVAVGGDGGIQQWGVLDGQELKPSWLTNGDTVWSVEYSPDDRSLLATYKEVAPRIWDTKTGQLLEEMVDAGKVHTASFSPNGKWIATGHEADPNSDERENVARLWKREQFKAAEHAKPLVHRNAVVSVAFRNDSEWLATGGYDNFARLWRVADGTQVGLSITHPNGVVAVRFSSERRKLVTACLDGVARLWEIPDGLEYGSPLVHSALVSSLAYDPSGRRLALGGGDGNLYCWKLNSDGSPINQAPESPQVLKHTFPVHSVGFSNNGGTLLTRSGEKDSLEIRSYDAKGGEPLEVWNPRGSRPCLLAVPIDDRDLLLARRNGVEHWHLRPERGMDWRMTHPGPTSLAVDRTRNRFVVGGNDGKVWVCDLRGQPTAKFEGHRGWVGAVAILPDGKSFLSGGRDGIALHRNIESGEQIGTVMHHKAWIVGVAASPDGQLALTASRDETARLWDAATGIPIGPPLRHSDWLTACAFSPDGDVVLTTGQDGTARFWRVPSILRGDPAKVRGLIEAWIGFRRNERGTTRVLTPEEWKEVSRQ